MTDILTVVQIATGEAPLSACPVADANGDQQVSLEEILQAVNNALDGCPYRRGGLAESARLIAPIRRSRASHFNRTLRRTSHHAARRRLLSRTQRRKQNVAFHSTAAVELAANASIRTGLCTMRRACSRVLVVACSHAGCAATQPAVRQHLPS